MLSESTNKMSNTEIAAQTGITSEDQVNPSAVQENSSSVQPKKKLPIKKPEVRRATIHTSSPSHPPSLEDDTHHSPSNPEEQSTSNDIPPTPQTSPSGDIPPTPQTSPSADIAKDLAELEQAQRETEAVINSVPNNLLSKEELEQKLESLTLLLDEERRTNERLRRSSKPREIKVSQKGAVQINNIRKFPITFYKSEWEVIIGMIPEIQQFITDHASELKEI